MKKKSISLALLAVGLSANAQFYTIENENVKKKVIENVQVENAAKYAKETESTIEADSLMLDTITPQKAEVCFDMPKHKEIAIEYDVPLFVSVKDSMMYELLGRRRSISLPLAFLRTLREAISLSIRMRTHFIPVFRKIWYGVRYVRN
jgi:ribosomal protein L5